MIVQMKEHGEGLCRRSYSFKVVSRCQYRNQHHRESLFISFLHHYKATHKLYHIIAFTLLGPLSLAGAFFMVSTKLGRL
jgi:hypothetical protein